MERVRRHLCGHGSSSNSKSGLRFLMEREGGLEADGDDSPKLIDLEIYEVKNTTCPEEGFAESVCQTVYVHFDLLIPDLDGDLEEIESHYTDMTKQAIKDGWLEVDEDVTEAGTNKSFIIVGPGAEAYPTNHGHGNKRDLVVEDGKPNLRVRGGGGIDPEEGEAESVEDDEKKAEKNDDRRALASRAQRFLRGMKGIFGRKK